MSSRESTPLTLATLFALLSLSTTDYRYPPQTSSAELLKYEKSPPYSLVPPHNSGLAHVGLLHSVLYPGISHSRKSTVTPGQAERVSILFVRSICSSHAVSYVQPTKNDTLRNGRDFGVDCDAYEQSITLHVINLSILLCYSNCDRPIPYLASSTRGYLIEFVMLGYCLERDLSIPNGNVT